MKPVTPEELSALLDGELDDARAREVEAQIVAHPRLRAEFDALSGADARWRGAAAAAVFTPRVKLPKTAWSLNIVIVAVALAAGLICLRAAPKLMESLAFGFGLHIVCFAILLASLPWLMRPDRSAASG